MSIRYERITVTPAIAKKWLGMNSENNRHPKGSKIPNYARDIKTGNWETDSGETIKFAGGEFIDGQIVGGTLIDGQNRMHAVVLADVPVAFDVAYGLPVNAMTVIDAGSARTFSDTLIIAGAGGGRMQASSIVRWVMLWDSGNYRGAGGKISPTHSEMLSVYRSDAGLFDAAGARGRDCSGRGLGTASAMGTAYALFKRIDGDDAVMFFDHIVTGANLQEFHPALTLRNRLMRAKIDRSTRQEQLALTIRAWNAFRAQESLQKIMITNSGDLNNTNFPQPK